MLMYHLISYIQRKYIIQNLIFVVEDIDKDRLRLS